MDTMTATQEPDATELVAADHPTPSHDRLVGLWLHGRPASTVKVYLAALDAFARGTGGKPLARVTLADLQDHADALAHLKPATRAKRLAALKSLFTFAAKLGYLALDPARALRLPKRADDLAARILDAAAVARIADAEPDPRRRRPINTVTAWRWFKAAATRAGLPAPSPHWLRHALDGGAPMHLVARTLGHASLATTSRYAHARPGESSGNYLDLGGPAPQAATRDPFVESTNGSPWDGGADG